jgi:anaerobic selenocysteine-containing dehydrogenase
MRVARQEHRSTFQFCENGAKAVTWEATKKRVTPEFFAAHTVTLLLEWNDHQLEGEGRLTHPMSKRVSGLLGGKLCALSPHTLEDFV